jgi:hypothetical protein
MGMLSALLSVFSGCDKREGRALDGDTKFVKADELLFSMPTICDELPPSDRDAVIPANALQMHEDYWRQVEFVESSSVPQVAKALREFVAFREAHRKGAGFTKTYIRKNVYPSLEKLGIKRQEVAQEARPIVIYGALAVDTFAIIDGSGAYLYGYALPDGTVKYMGIEPPSGKPMSESFRNHIAAIAQEHRLILIDWYKGTLVEKVTSDVLVQWAAMYETAEQGDQAKH